MATQEAEARYFDGNHEPIPSGEVVDLAEGAEFYAIDGHGNELRVGDLVLVESTGRSDGYGSEWVGAIAKVASAGSSGIYPAGGGVRDDLTRGDGDRKWWPTHNSGVGIERVSYPGRSTWAIHRTGLRKIDLSTQDGRRLRLAGLHQDLSGIDAAMARVLHDRAAKLIEIRELSGQIEDAEQEFGAAG